MTDKARKIFDMLGVVPGEEFKLSRGMLFRFHDDLTLQYKFSEQHWEAVENIDTYRKILTGETRIIKISEGGAE